MVNLGINAPDFRLADPFGTYYSLASFQSAKGLLVVFMCNHCPFVLHVAEKLVEIGQVYPKKGIAVVGINSNDVEKYPADHPTKMAEEIKKQGYTFPYLFDESQEIARVYGAACTPDFFLFNEARQLVYRGQLDASRPGNSIPVTGADLCRAMDALINGQEIAKEQTPSIGCNIKWKEA